VTDEPYRRQGAATALLKRCLADRDPEGLPCLLTASAAGEPLYSKLGWQRVDRIYMKDEEGRVVCEAPSMLREPRPLLEYKIERAHAEDSLEISRVRVRAFVSFLIFSTVTAEAISAVWPGRLLRPDLATVES
jgi:hypothetical protein